MSDFKLLRFLNQETGPVVSMVSVPYPGFWSRKLWHSRAILRPDIKIGRGSLVFDSCGSGWSASKQESQCRALTEAVERWALAYYRKFPEKAALDVDGTSTGFAALPSDFNKKDLYENAYCEAVERWILNAVWDAGGIGLLPAGLNNQVLQGLFKRFPGRLHGFTTRMPVPAPSPIGSPMVFFSLCLFETAEGGVVPGSACGLDESKVMDRAMAEAYMHALALSMLKKKVRCEPEDILEKRILYFGGRPTGFSEVKERLASAPARKKPEIPKVIFFKELEGPWNPEINIVRVVLEGSVPFLCGGEDRFVI